MIFQDPYASLNPRMTVYDALAEAIRTRHPEVRGDALRQRVIELLERVGPEPGADEEVSARIFRRAAAESGDRPGACSGAEADHRR
jgi:ABC-type glutathione transport system ATPase component